MKWPSRSLKCTFAAIAAGSSDETSVPATITFAPCACASRTTATIPSQSGAPP